MSTNDFCPYTGIYYVINIVNCSKDGSNILYSTIVNSFHETPSFKQELKGKHSFHYWKEMSIRLKWEERKLYKVNVDKIRDAMML